MTFLFLGWHIPSHLLCTLWFVWLESLFPQSHQIMNLWAWILSCPSYLREIKTFDPWTEEVTDDRLQKTLLVKVSEVKIGAKWKLWGTGYKEEPLTTESDWIYFLFQLHKCSYFCYDYRFRVSCIQYQQNTH